MSLRALFRAAPLAVAVLLLTLGVSLLGRMALRHYGPPDNAAVRLEKASCEHADEALWGGC